RGNSTSTTGPITRTTRPLAALVRLESSRVTAAVISRFSSCVSVAFRAGRQGIHAADDFADFLRDVGLPQRVGLPGQGTRQFIGVVGGRLHCGAPSRML